MALFEIGSVYHTDEVKLTKLPQEKSRLASCSSANGRKRDGTGRRAPLLLDAKGLLEAIMRSLGLEEQVTFAAATDADGFHPGRTAALQLHGDSGASDVETIGYVGQLHPDLAREFDLPDVYAAELELSPLYERADPASCTGRCRAILRRNGIWRSSSRRV